MNLRGLLALAALAVTLAGAAHAQAVEGLDGRWEGAIPRSNGLPVRAVFHVTTDAGRTTVAFDSPDQGAWGLAATVSRTGESMTFHVPMAQMTYVAKLSVDGKTLTGEVAQGDTAVPLILTQKPASAVAALTSAAVNGLDGTWEGAIVTPIGDITVLFHVATKHGRTTTTMDTPGQGARDIPALTKRAGDKVTVEVPGILASFSADLSGDGKALVGEWTQSGQELALTIKRK